MSDNGRLCCREQLKLTREGAIAIRIIAAEKCVAPVAIDSLVVPASNLTRRSVAKISAVMLRRVAIPDNVIFGMVGQRDCILEALAKLRHFCMVCMTSGSESRGWLLGPTSQSCHYARLVVDEPKEMERVRKQSERWPSQQLEAESIA